jgi:hypothetical protein
MKPGVLIFLFCYCSVGYTQIGLFKPGFDLPDPAIFDSLTCNQLYSEAIRLEGNTMRYKQPVMNASMDMLVSAASTVYKPVLAYYGYKIPRHFWKEKEIYETTLIMDHVRQRMSALRCFER